MSNNHTKRWAKQAHTALVGLTIVDAFYPTPDMIKELQLPGCGVMFTLSNGTVWMPFADSEGNDAGVLAVVDLVAHAVTKLPAAYPQHLPKL